MTFIETPPHLIPQPTRLSPLRELSPVELVDDYASTDDLLRDARDYTAVLDFNVNIPAEHDNGDSVDSGPGIEPIFEQIRDVSSRTCSYRPENLRPEEPRPWKPFPGEHCRRHRRLLLCRTRCRRAIRQRQRPLQRLLRPHQNQLRVAPLVRRHVANLSLRWRARQVYRRADKHAVARSAWQDVSSNVHCTTYARSLSTPT